MENNEISMFMDVKLDIDKRIDALKYKAWTKCQVKIEAVKCLPCFLRINIKRLQPREDEKEEEQSLCVSINVPGVNVSLAESRTKKYSYGLFWVQNRRDCYIYFALETEMNCRLHMKWIKKSIKNLELHRQIWFEQRRSDRNFTEEQQEQQQQQGVATAQVQERLELKHMHLMESVSKSPNYFDSHNNSWSRRISRASEIYEEIFEGTQFIERPRLSRRLSGVSIASGIYEEMKPTTLNFNAIVEEALEATAPPLPPPRKRFNTCENEGLLGEIPRSNTNPETEMSKMRKCKNMFDSIFGSGRAKRAESVSESHATCVEDLIRSTTPRRSSSSGGGCRGEKQNQQHVPIYANDIICVKKDPQTTKRNSHSSPDLSRINFLDTFDEEKLADLLQQEYTSFDDMSFGPEPLDESAVLPAPNIDANSFHKRIYQAHKECLNISSRLPQNFNFSAVNSSTLNLIGANGAVVTSTNPRKHKVLIDELTGYCIMAPIKQKASSVSSDNQNQDLESKTTTASAACAVPASTESTSSGYSTGSYSSSTSSCLNSNEAPINQLTTTGSTVAEDSSTLKFQKESHTTEDSVIYENMNGGSMNSTGSSKNESTTTPNTILRFTENLYENLLTIKAAQELEQIPLIALSTSTPTEAPFFNEHMADENVGNSNGKAEEEESYYQTPRKSIISVDEKIPSYYPNSCDTVKMRRYQASPTAALINIQTTPTSSLYESSNRLSGSFRHSQRKRQMLKENIDLSTMQQISNSMPSATTSPAASIVSTTSNSSLSVRFQKTKRTAAHKISETVYAVTHAHRRSANSPNTGAASNQSRHSNYNNNHLEESAEAYANMIKEKLNAEMLQLAMLQKIDFKFDDARQMETAPAVEMNTPKHKTRAGHKRQLSQHYLQVHQATNKAERPRTPSPGRAIMTQSKIETKVSSASKEPDTASTSSSSDLNGGSGGGGFRKFASLPRFKKIDLSPLKMRINNVLQRNQTQNTEF